VSERPSRRKIIAVVAICCVVLYPLGYGIAYYLRRRPFIPMTTFLYSENRRVDGVVYAVFYPLHRLHVLFGCDLHLNETRRDPLKPSDEPQAP
jgi:hypothetical protein